jgi:hypothetical protein
MASVMIVRSCPVQVQHEHTLARWTRAPSVRVRMAHAVDVRQESGTSLPLQSGLSCASNRFDHPGSPLNLWTRGVGVRWPWISARAHERSHRLLSPRQPGSLDGQPSTPIRGCHIGNSLQGSLGVSSAAARPNPPRSSSRKGTHFPGAAPPASPQPLPLLTKSLGNPGQN